MDPGEMILLVVTKDRGFSGKIGHVLGSKVCDGDIEFHNMISNISITGFRKAADWSLANFFFLREKLLGNYNFNTSTVYLRVSFKKKIIAQQSQAFTQT